MNTRTLILGLLILIPMGSLSQTRPAYCEITNISAGLLSNKNTVIIDLGADRKGTITDSSGKAIRFNSHIDVLNYMSRLGWHLIQAYPYSDTSSKQKVIRFLLEKTITDDSQISEGITIKQPEKYERGKSGDDMY